MSNNTLTLTLSSKTRERLQEEAEKDPGYISLERHINKLLARHVERPDWSDVTEIAALAAEVEKLTRQLDSAQGWADWWRSEHDRERDRADRMETALASAGYTDRQVREL